MLLKKFFNVGFEDIRVVDRRSVGLEHIALYPLFTTDFLDLLQRVTPMERRTQLVFAVTVTARKPS